MAKRYKITNLSSAVQTYEGNLIYPRTSRVIELETGFSDRAIDRLGSRGVFIKETNEAAQNGQALPAADPQLVDAYAKLATLQGAAREEVLADLGYGAAKPASNAAPQKVAKEG